MLILTVDDDIVNNLIIRENIKIINKKIVVIEKSTLVDAICFLRNCREKATIPEFIFCDYNLPPYSGKDFIRIFKRFFLQKCASTKIYLISAAVDQNLKDEIVGYDFIAGLYNKTDFDEKLKKIILAG